MNHPTSDNKNLTCSTKCRVDSLLFAPFAFKRTGCFTMRNARAFIVATARVYTAKCIALTTFGSTVNIGFSILCIGGVMATPCFPIVITNNRLTCHFPSPFGCGLVFHSSPLFTYSIQHWGGMSRRFPIFLENNAEKFTSRKAA